MDKRGQVTVFIILGIFLLAAVIVGLVISNAFTKGAAEEQFDESASFSKQVDFVQEHVDECVEEKLTEAIPYFANKNIESVEEYKDAVSTFVKQRMDSCLRFEQFEGLEIDAEDEKSVKIAMDEKKTLLSALVKFDLTINKEDSSETLSEFYAEKSLIGEK